MVDEILDNNNDAVTLMSNHVVMPNGSVIFTGDHDTYGKEVFTWTGLPSDAPKLAVDVHPGSSDSSPNYLTQVGESWVFCF